MLSSAYPKLLIFLLAILILAYASSSLPFCMIYSAYRLNKQDDNIQPWCTPISIWNQSLIHVSSNCCFLTCIQVSQEADKVVWCSHLLNFPQFVVIHTVEGFSIVSEAQEDIFSGILLFFYDPADVGNLVSDSSAFSKSSLYIWKFSVHVLLKPGLENFEHYFASMWNECSCAVVRAFFGIAFLRDWNENWPSPVTTADFSKFAGTLSASL